MTRCLRLILPSPVILFTFAAFYVVVELPLWFIRVRWGVVPPPGKHPGDVLVIMVALAYGAFRALAFHPFYRPDYHVWLARTPWSSRKPLPIGPASLVWEDLVILGVLGALCHRDSFLDPVIIMAFPVMGHTLLLTRALFPTGAPAFGYVALFLLGLAVSLAPHRWAFLAAAAGAGLLAHLGLRRSLARFPWYPGWQHQWWQFLTPKTGEEQSRTRCGWPYDALRCDLSDVPRIAVADAALVSLLAGWWLFAVCSLIPDPHDRRTAHQCVMSLGTIIFSFGRLGLYCIGYRPPINVWGRIATFRWIISGYDQVFVGPLGSVLVAFAGPAVLIRGALREELAFPFAFALMIFVALGAPPGLRRWRLTGRHRMVPALDQSQYIRVG